MLNSKQILLRILNEYYLQKFQLFGTIFGNENTETNGIQHRAKESQVYSNKFTKIGLNVN